MEDTKDSVRVILIMDYQLSIDLMKKDKGGSRTEGLPTTGNGCCYGVILIMDGERMDTVGYTDFIVTSRYQRHQMNSTGHLKRLLINLPQRPGRNCL